MKIINTIILIALMVTTMGLVKVFKHSENILPNKDFSTFPMEISEWSGEKSSLDDKVYNILGVEDYILANYRSNPDKIVNLYVGFYQSQKEGDIIHSPKNCMPGAGWKITRTAHEEIRIGDGEHARVIKLILQKGSQKQVVLYWFQSRGRIISSEYAQKIWLVVDSIFKNRTDGSFVRLISPVIKNEADALAVLKDFAGQIYPYLKKYIPS